ncbi:unnamed protein product [Caenorhabditis brenneri]
MPSLLDMTDIPMTNILEKCGFESVLTLRKVCHSLRNFIDDSCFKTDLDNIRMTIGLTGFSVFCQTQQTFGFAKDWTSNDLKVLLKMVQSSKLSSFSVNINPDSVRGLDDLDDVLRNQTRPLQTERFEMEGSDILKVLPYIDSKTLKKICIRPTNNRDANQNLDEIENVMELEQFKNAVLHETSLEELVALKEAFVTSTHMVYFNLNGLNLNGNQLEQLFGTPFHNPCYGEGTQWFFKIQNCKEFVLRIYWYSGWLKFRKLEANEVPQDAVVQH